MNRILSVTIALISTLSLFSQTEIDALRFSNTKAYGSARFTAMGGSMGALGGDLSVVSTNPAGISVMNSSQVTFTPYLRNTKTRTQHYGNSVESSHWNLRMSNLGLNVRMREDDDQWSNVYLTYSYNNKLDFNNRTNLEGVNPESSQLDVFFNRYLSEQGTNLGQLEEGYPFDISLAWNTFLLDTFNDFFFTAVPNYGQTQIYSHEETGRIGENNFAFSGLFRDKLYLGASIGLSSASYSLTNVLREEIPESDTSTFLNSFDYEQNLIMTGSATSIKLGAIYKWSEWLRTGIAFHSPDFYSFVDRWSSNITADYESGSFEAESLEGNYEYQIQTPWRIIGSVAFSLQKFFVFNADYEYLDYSSTRLKGVAGVNNPFGYENDWLKNNAGAGHNLRFGAEYNYKSYSFRTGFAYYDNPANTVFNSSTRTFSFGIGNTLEVFYWDLAFRQQVAAQQYFWVYNPSYAPIEASTRTTRSSSGMLTVGLRF